MIKINLDTVKKIFFVKVSGVLALPEIEAYVKDFEEKLGQIDPKQYFLLIDAKEQKTIAPEGVPLLEKCMKMYVETPFKKRFSVVLESAIAMLQVKKVGKDTVEPFIMITDVEEAYKQM